MLFGPVVGISCTLFIYNISVGKKKFITNEIEDHYTTSFLNYVSRINISLLDRSDMIQTKTVLAQTGICISGEIDLRQVTCNLDEMFCI